MITIDEIDQFIGVCFGRVIVVWQTGRRLACLLFLMRVSVCVEFIENFTLSGVRQITPVIELF